MKKTNLTLLVIAVFTLSTFAQGQFGSLKKLATGKQDSNAPDAAHTLVQSADFVKLITVATDQGVLAMDELAQAFPSEKVAAFSDLSKKYHESQAKRTDGNINAEQVQTASAMSAEIAKLQNDWQSYKKGGAQSVAKADRRLGIMLLADGVAGAQLPTLSKSLQSNIESVTHDPTQASKLSQLKAYAQLFTVVGQEMPKQVSSFKTVRSVTKQIATAEKMTLPPDPSPDSIKDVASVTSATKEIS